LYDPYEILAAGMTSPTWRRDVPWYYLHRRLVGQRWRKVLYPASMYDNTQYIYQTDKARARQGLEDTFK
jgi:hypothetical protein